MPRTKSTSSSRAAEERLVRIPLERLHPHPANANVMSEERRAKLVANIGREGRYPPIIVRPHPTLPGQYQKLDGHQRTDVLDGLGHADALCYVWPCDDATALVLLATLNRLEGEDVPAKRADLLRQLTELLPDNELALLLPESEALIQDTIALFSVDSAGLLAQIEEANAREQSSGPRLISFAVRAEDEALIEEALSRASRDLEGLNKRGRALAFISRSFLGAD